MGAIFSAIVSGKPVSSEAEVSMALDYNGKIIVDPATKTHVQAAIDTLKNDPKGHFMLIREAMTYMQTCQNTVSGGFALEYQDGDISRHYVYENANGKRSLSLDQLTRMCMAYLEDDEATWRHSLNWVLDVSLGHHEQVYTTPKTRHVCATKSSHEDDEPEGEPGGMFVSAAMHG